MQFTVDTSTFHMARFARHLLLLGVKRETFVSRNPKGGCPVVCIRCIPCSDARCVIPHEIDFEAGKVQLHGGRQYKYKPIPDVPDGWIDPDFPHDETSIGQKLKYIKVKWCRVPTITATPVLFENLEPADICQGHW